MLAYTCQIQAKRILMQWNGFGDNLGEFPKCFENKKPILINYANADMTRDIDFKKSILDT